LCWAAPTAKAVNITIPSKKASASTWHPQNRELRSGQALSLKVDALKSAFPSNKATSSHRKKFARPGNLRKIYGEYGFIDFTPEPETEVDDAAKIINLNAAL